MAKEFSNQSSKTNSYSASVGGHFFSKENKQEDFFKSPDSDHAFFRPDGIIASAGNTTSNPVQKKQENGGNLPDEIQEKMENSFDADFSSVRVHENSNRANDLKAIAFTQGSDIYFAPGYNPYSSQGQEYLGHELTHVVQQNAGRVEPTYQEAGFNVSDNKILESQADSAGKKSVTGQFAVSDVKYSGKPNKKAIQKKDAPIQLLRLFPAGAPIFELDIRQVEDVISTFSALWRSFNRYGWLTTDFVNHPELPDIIRTVLGGNYFRGSNSYVSQWFDDGVNDLFNFGVLDNDVRIIMSLLIDHEVGGTIREGAFNAGGTVTDTSTATQTRALTAGVEVEQAIPGGTVTGNVSGSHSQEDSRSMAVSGTTGLTMNSPAQIISANILFRCELKVNPAGRPITSRHVISPIVGTIRFGAPI